jgi:hypothetical protein
MSVRSQARFGRAKPFANNVTVDHIYLQFLPDNVGAAATLTHESHAATQ